MAKLVDKRVFPAVNQITDYVQSELFNRKRMPLNGTRVFSPFVKFTSMLSKTEVGQQENFFTLGLHGYRLTGNNALSLSYGNTDYVGYTYSPSSPNSIDGAGNSRVIRTLESVDTQNQQTAAAGRHPAPGVKSVTVAKGSPGLITKATISWVCYNLSQLNVLRKYFATPGAYAVLEWGHQAANDSSLRTIDFTKVNQTVDMLKEYLLLGRSVADSYHRDNDCRYDFMVGRISNFNFTLTNQGYYECSTELIGPAESMYGLTNNNTIVLPLPNDTRDFQVTISDYFGTNVENRLSEDQTSSQGVTENGREILWSTQIQRDNGRDEANTPEGMKDNQTYVTWRYFTKRIIPDLISFLETTTQASPNFRRYFDFAGTDDDAESITYVGYSPRLRSIDAGVCIIANSAFANILSSEFQKSLFGPVVTTTVTSPAAQSTTGFNNVNQIGNQTFGNVQAQPIIGAPNAQSTYTPDNISYKARMDDGVWLNMNMIKTAFAQTRYFHEALDSILNSLSNASANYWNLAIVFDDRRSRFVIIDNKLNDRIPEREFYVFNDGNRSELIDVSFGTQLSDLQKTQILLSNASYVEEADAVNLQELAQQVQTSPTSANTAKFEDALISQLNSEYSKFLFRQEDAINKRLVDLLDQSLKQAERPAANNPPTIDNNEPRSGTYTNSQGNPATAASYDPASAPAPFIDPSSIDVQNQRLVESVKNIRVETPPNQRDTLAFANNNPGNIKWRPGLTRIGPFPVRRGYPSLRDPNVIFALFDSLEDGFGAVKVQVRLYYERDNITTISGIINKYAPPVENNTEQYINEVSAELNIGRDTPLTRSQFEAALDPLARAIVRKESSSVVRNGAATADQLREREDAQRQERIRRLNGGRYTRPDGTTSNDLPARTAAEQEARDIQEKHVDKYGRNLTTLVELFPSRMKSQILFDLLERVREARTAGDRLAILQRLDNIASSPYGLPVATDVNLSMRLQGISGLCLGDAFYIAKIPEEYSEYGVFQMKSIVETIDPTGWTTEVGALYRLLWRMPRSATGIPRINSSQNQRQTQQDERLRARGFLA